MPNGRRLSIHLNVGIRHSAFGLALAALCAAGACGGSSPAAPTQPPAANPNVVTISSSGVSPKEIQVAPGARVLFVNNDGRRHDVASDDHPDHLECPAINQVGLLTSGQQRETGNLVTVRTCGYHDHDDPDNNSLKGRIVIR
jgi:plastocyanin